MAAVDGADRVGSALNLTSLLKGLREFAANRIGFKFVFTLTA